MSFCIIRLGKSSKEEILKINSITDNNLTPISIDIRAKQVPGEVSAGSYCFLWLGSDNNKGTPTTWKQGLRAIGRVNSKTGGEQYMDDAFLNIEIGVVFRRSLNKTEILRAAGITYINIANIPVIGLNTSSNQTVQVVKPAEDGQSVTTLLNTVFNSQKDTKESLEKKYPSLIELYANSEIDFHQSGDEGEQQEGDIEETDETNVEIKIPFDPNLIRLRRDPYTLGELIDRIEHNEINFFTGFQRKAGLWDLVQQSRLIESILLRLPLPAFYFDETEDNKWQVIDGLQRTTTIKNFIVDGSLELEKLEFLTQLNGIRYNKLPRDLTRRIKTTPLTVYVIEKGTPDEVKFNIFRRINTGGLVLVPQEIRHALNQGIPAKFVEELANVEEFKQATMNIIKSDRMEDRDFVTRFVSFYRVPFYEYEPDLDSFMTKGMASLKSTTQADRKIIKERFITAMNTAMTIFENDAFRKRENLTDRRKPLNKALFETISVEFAKLNNDDINVLIAKKADFREKFMDLNRDIKFIYSISSGTGQLESVVKRFHDIRAIIQDTLNEE